MGKRVDYDMKMFKGKELMSYSFSYKNENVLYLLDKKTGDTIPVRIPAALVGIMDSYADMRGIEGG